MICFALQCAHDHRFEGWFKDGATFELQAEAGKVACPTCGDVMVRKAMMAPAVLRSARKARRVPAQAETPPVPAPAEPPDQLKAAMAIGMLRKIREHVEKNFEHVGERFPEEARRIHYGEAEEREIFGEATLEQANELIEEGISIRALPNLPKLDG